MAMPMPILAPVDRPDDEAFESRGGGLLDFGVDVLDSEDCKVLDCADVDVLDCVDVEVLDCGNDGVPGADWLTSL